ncbi:MAG: class I SAM-dependent methyltransferase [Deltaproteobacteria bacterium]|nr:class I SAM-dependent methyltransferase [Deltaproteobacteria bacterium]
MKNKYEGFVPPGHFASTIPNLDEIKEAEDRVFGIPPRRIPGIRLNEEQQLELLSSFTEFYETVPFPRKPSEGFRYYFDNPGYGYSDAIFLYCMIRHLKPRHIIEVGSGYSSCVTLDTNRLFFDDSIDCTFIEPYPQLLLSLIDEKERQRISIIPRKLQEVPLEVFEILEPNDILFIDSTHIVKTFGDVNRVFFEILPAIASGVFVHFHDIWYPFEYPKEAVYQGVAWNEIYVLRAFLQYNEAFRIVAFNTFLEQLFPERFQESLPMCLENKGASIWIQKM